MWLLRNILLLCLLCMAFGQTYAESGFSPQNFSIKEEASNHKEVNGFGLSKNLRDDNSLYDEIMNHFSSRYESIAQRQLDSINDGRDLSIWGGLNHIGLTYSKPFLNFSVEFKRDLAPDLFDDHRWIVTDNMSIIIDAQKLLSNLKDQDIIDISEKQYAAFAGITFKRTYKHVHFADSYEDGLKLNLDRLFFSFLNFKNLKFLELQDYEFITKEDQLSLAIGAVGNVPLYYGFSASAGGLVQYKNFNKVEIQKLGPEDNAGDENLRISYEREKITSIGASASILYDFLGLLRFTIFKYDFTYEKSENYRVNLSFDNQNINNIVEPKILNEVNQIVSHRKANLQVLAPFLVSEELRKKEKIKSKYSLLLLGGSREKQTEHIQIVKDNKVTTFFKHNFEKLKYVENAFSRLFQVLIKSFLRLDSFVNKKSSELSSLKIEYKSERNLIKHKEVLKLQENQEVLSFKFDKSFYTYKTKKKDKKKAVELLNNFAGSDPLVTNLLDQDYIKGPLRIDINFKMGGDAVSYFNNLSLNQAYDRLNAICSQKKKSIFKFFRSLFGGCKKELQRSYDALIVDNSNQKYTKKDYDRCSSYSRKRYRSARHSRKKYFIKNCLSKMTKKSNEQIRKEIPVWSYKEFLGKVHDHANSKVDYFSLFGVSNVFQSGTVEALKRDDSSFYHFFKEGQYQGDGVVSNHLKASRSRIPASVTH